MPKGKKRGRKMPKWRRYLKMAVGLAGKAIGAGVALSPMIEQGQRHLPNDPARFFVEVGNDYTGASGADIPRAMNTYGRAIAGFVVMWVTSAIAKRI